MPAVTPDCDVRHNEDSRESRAKPNNSELAGTLRGAQVAAPAFGKQANHFAVEGRKVGRLAAGD